MSRGSDPVSIMQLDRPMRCRSWVNTFMFVKSIYESQERDGVWLHGKVTQHNTKKENASTHTTTHPPTHISHPERLQGERKNNQTKDEDKKKKRSGDECVCKRKTIEHKLQ